MAANLGEATTKELLEEVQARMKLGDLDIEGVPIDEARRTVYDKVNISLARLSDDDLNYRTI